MSKPTPPPVKLEIEDLAVGAGAEAKGPSWVTVHYTGWLTDGTKFDSSRDTMPNGQPRTPIAFPQGARRVIAGWDAGFEGMRVGGKRRLIIPYQLAYGEKGRPPVIPPKSTLVFDVELMAVADTLPREAGATLIWDGPTDLDPARQNEVVESWITRGVDVIAVSVENKASISTALRKARSRAASRSRSNGGRWSNRGVVATHSQRTAVMGSVREARSAGR